MTTCRCEILESLLDRLKSVLLLRHTYSLVAVTFRLRFPGNIPTGTAIDLHLHINQQSEPAVISLLPRPFREYACSNDLVALLHQSRAFSDALSAFLLRANNHEVENDKMRRT